MSNLNLKYSDRSQIVIHQHSYLVDLIRKRNYRTLLDVGCGNADKAIVFASKLRMSVVALDEFEGRGSDVDYQEISSKVIGMNLQNQIEVVKQDALKISQLGRQFDVVFMQNVLHHLFPWPHSKNNQHVHSFFSDVKQTVVPGGVFYMTDSGNWNFWDRLHRYLPGEWYKVKMFRSINQVDFESKTPASYWLGYLNELGFCNIHLHYYVPRQFRGMQFLLNNSFASSLIESSYSIAATRPA